MFRVALKDLLARKRRLVTTGLAIVLGIAFLTGTQLLSASLSDSIDDLIGDVYDGIDAVVRSPDSQDTPFGQPIRPPVPASLVADVAAVDGVRAAEGFVESTGPQLIGSDGKVYGAAGFGPPTIVYNWIDDEQLRTGRINEGRGPEADDEIALDFDTVEGLEVAVGDPVTLANQQEGTEEFTLVGVLGLGEDGTKSSGARPMFFTTPTAQRLVDQTDAFNFVAVAAEDGVGQDELVERLAFELPSVQVLTGEAFTEESAESIGQFVDILNIFVSVFGYIALFVAIFIIYNTFSIVVTQRTRETALLRAIGARRRQVLAATMLEALVVGVLAAIIGLLLGTLLAAGLIQLVGSVFTVASGVPPLTVSAVLTALVVGIVVTVRRRRRRGPAVGRGHPGPADRGTGQPGAGPPVLAAGRPAHPPGRRERRPEPQAHRRHGSCPHHRRDAGRRDRHRRVLDQGHRRFDDRQLGPVRLHRRHGLGHVPRGDPHRRGR